MRTRITAMFIVMITATGLVHCSQPSATRPQTHAYFPLIAGIATKHGAAMTSTNCHAVDLLGASWCHNWKLYPDADCRCEFAPTVWGLTNMNEAAPPSRVLFTWNEPNQCPDQACIDPEAAAVAWPAIEWRYADERLIVSPSATSAAWTAAWYAAVVQRTGFPPHFDFIGAHCYRVGLIALNQCIDEWLELARRWRKPVIVGEWAAIPCWVGGYFQAVEITRQFRERLDAEPWVYWHSAFATEYSHTAAWTTGWTRYPSCNTSLVRNGQLTPLGEAYRGEIP
jgi:hypothetical protein